MGLHSGVPSGRTAELWVRVGAEARGSETVACFPFHAYGRGRRRMLYDAAWSASFTGRSRTSCRLTPLAL